MPDFYEIDFLDVETDKSGDAIALRYMIGNDYRIHVVDGGFDETGKRLVEHINNYYNNPSHIHHVVVTHQDGDHTGGLKHVLHAFGIGALWMLRPWVYAHFLFPHFNQRFRSVGHLADRLREDYPNIAELEEIALDNGIPIYEPFQGARIGAFTVTSPTKQRFLHLILQSEKTAAPRPEYTNPFLGLGQMTNPFQGLGQTVLEKARAAVALVRAAWGAENFSSEPISAENNMSVVQYANLSGHQVLLTGDTGVAGLAETIACAPLLGLILPGIHRFQVPHHGARRNMNTATLDRLLGPRLPMRSAAEPHFCAIISSAEADKDHPRKVAIRSMIHRGGQVLTTEGNALWVYGGNAPSRGSYGPVTPLRYPEEEEV